MASLITIKHCLLVTLILCSVAICCTLGEDCDYEPQIGALGKHPDKGGSGGKDPGSDKGDKDPGPSPDEGGKDPNDSPGGEDSGSDDNEGDKDPVGDAIENDPAHIVANALLCFNEKEVYCSCEESYRLSESGELHVPHDRVEEFCNGPCLKETKLVISCIEGIMGHFMFFNKATTQDVRDTVLAACGQGEERGDFNVARHIKAKEGEEESIGYIGVDPFVPGILATFIAQIFITVNI